MRPSVSQPTSTRIVEQARFLGASLAGVASVEALRHSSSYHAYHDICDRAEWPEEARSVLVLALAHDPSKPELDWWDIRPGGTPGNHQLIRIATGLKQWLVKEVGLNGRPLPYGVDRGGIFLKDAAVLAGLGVIGKNNLLITAEFGPRVRLRALFLDATVEPGGPIDFDPCAACGMPCRRACPENAFRDGFYSRPLCRRQMAANEANRTIVGKRHAGGLSLGAVRYCRACELACVVACVGACVVE